MHLLYSCGDVDCEDDAADAIANEMRAALFSGRGWLEGGDLFRITVQLENVVTGRKVLYIWDKDDFMGWIFHGPFNEGEATFA